MSKRKEDSSDEKTQEVAQVNSVVCLHSTADLA